MVQVRMYVLSEGYVVTTQRNTHLIRRTFHFQLQDIPYDVGSLGIIFHEFILYWSVANSNTCSVLSKI